MIQVMEELRDRHLSQINGLNSKNQMNVKLKESEIQYLGEELKKIRMWLE